jgi:hypothetical protein
LKHKAGHPVVIGQAKLRQEQNMQYINQLKS